MLLSFLALGIAALGLAVLAIAGPAHRMGASLITALAIMRWAAYIGGGAALVSIVAGVLSYRVRGWLKLSVAAVSLVIALTTVGIGVSWQQRAASAPAIHDITTDLENPPTFTAVLARRGNAPNRLERTPQLADLQRQGYPDLAPITLSTKPERAFDRALAVAQSQGWEIVTADKSAGRIEATETTRWFGFVDDMAIRLTPWGAGTRIDVRSVSRSGLNDVGRNADRIRRFLKELQK